MKRFILIFVVTLCLIGTKMNAQEKVRVSANSEGQKFDHFWSRCVGAGRANEGLRAGWLEQLQMVNENCGFEYVRFHGLFHDDMFPVFENNGKIIYNWQYISYIKIFFSNTFCYTSNMKYVIHIFKSAR